MPKSLVTICKMMIAVIAIGVSSSLTASAQQAGTFSINGTVYEYTQGGDSVPVEFAVIATPDFGIATTSAADGTYTLKDVPRGKAVINVSYVGKVTIEKPVEVNGPMTVNFTLREENFKLKEVMVTAQASKAGGATSSMIGRNAMDHMQATSLSDIMSLLPGGRTSEPSLDEAKTINIRKAITSNPYVSNSAKSGAEAMNAMGTALIRDGAPISNNANMSTLSTAVKGETGTVGASEGVGDVNDGVDLRKISTDNIESIEVIRGIPSVEHGDLTSGAIIINSKAGREPLRITAKANPKVYMGSVSTGFSLGENRGGLNISADYAHNTNKPTQSYLSYQRASARVMYSKEFSRNLRSNTSLNFIYGKDQRSLNPDDESYQRASRGEDYGLTFNTNGLWSINKGWLKSLRYVASGTYTSRQSYYQGLATSNNTPYTGSLVDGAVITNRPGQSIFDAEGNEITNFGPEDADKYAYCIPSSYLTRYSIDSREVNVFGKLVATLFKQSGYVNNRILLGVDFRSDGNVGHGKSFNPENAPQREVTQVNASFRPRDYRDIPFLNHVGLFAEENFIWQMGLHELRIQAGVRYDHANRVGGIVSPRFNASFEVIPSKLWIRGGYGVTAKMPTMLYLFPERSYFEYINLNELATSSIPEEDRLYMTTTKVYDVDNSHLKIATNRKAEVGFDLRLGRSTLSVTGFYENLKNGYSLSKNFNTFSPFLWTEYTRDANGQIVEKSSSQVLSSWYAPGNDVAITSRGVEFDLSLGRIEKINTTFSLNGAWLRTRSSNMAYTFRDVTDGSVASKRKDIAIYDCNSLTFYEENMNTSLRITHNLPRIGFVVTLTGQAVWKDANWATYTNYDIPVGYMSLQDGKPHFFEKDQFASIEDFRDSEFGYMYENRKHVYEKRESFKPYFVFNMNVTKELGDLMRVSFFANNMFRSYPRRADVREPGTYYLKNNRFYFGVELSLTL